MNTFKVRNEFQLQGLHPAQHVAHAPLVKDIFSGCDFCVLQTGLPWLMMPIKDKWKGIISLYSCCKYTSLYMTKIASMWNRANGAVDDDVAWVEGFTASKPLNESLCCEASFWDLSWAACLWFDPCPERLFWTFGLSCSSSLMSPSTWDTGASRNPAAC